MAGGWLGVKSIPLGKRAELTLPLSQPGLRKCRGLNLRASARCSPATNLSKGGLQMALCGKFGAGKGRFLTYHS